MSKKRHYDNALQALIAYKSGVEVWVEGVEAWQDDEEETPVWSDPFPIEHLDVEYIYDMDIEGGCLVDKLEREDDYTRFYSIEEEA